MPPEGRRYRKPARSGPDMSTWSAEDKAAHELKKRLATPVAEMALSVRVINALEAAGVILADQLVQQTYDSLMTMKNFGEKTLDEVRAALVALGLDPPKWEKPARPPKPPRERPGRGGVSLFD